MNPQSSVGKVNRANENKKKKARSANLFKKGEELHSLQNLEVLIVLYDPLRDEFSHYSSSDPKSIFFGLLRMLENGFECPAPPSLPEFPVRPIEPPRKMKKKQDSSPALSLKDLLSAPSNSARPPLATVSPLSLDAISGKPPKSGLSHSGFDLEACSTKESSNWDLYRGGTPQPPSSTNLSHYSGSSPELRRSEEDARSQSSRSQEDWLDQF